MRYLNLLLPFSLVSDKEANHVIDKNHIPALATLLTRHANSILIQTYNQYSKALPHEHWLSQKIGLPSILNLDKNLFFLNTTPAIAAIPLHLYQQNLTSGYWFIIHPVHFHVGFNNLILTPMHQLKLTNTESRKFFKSARLLCELYHCKLLYINAQTWLLRADAWSKLHTSSPLIASGKNVNTWMPTGQGAKEWFQLNNEIQMQWSLENLNQERQDNQQHEINSLWIWGGTDATILKNAKIGKYITTYNSPQELINSTSFNITAENILSNLKENSFLTLFSLIEPRLTNEWNTWLNRIIALDQYWFNMLLEALHNKKLNRLSIVLSNENTLKHVTVTSLSVKKFWIKKNIKDLIV